MVEAQVSFDEDKAFRIEVVLVLEPALQTYHDVGTVLFAGMHRLLSVIPCRSKNCQTAAMLACTPLASAFPVKRPSGWKLVLSAVSYELA